jgi:hypothetical protein
MKQIFWVLMIVVVVIAGAVWYSHRSKSHAVTSGDVYVRDQTGNKTRPQAPLTASGNQPAQSGQPAAANPAGTQTANQPGAQTQPAVVAPPAADSIRRNPPNGMSFAGTGKYQLYRQGDLTWRLNTETGDACILFATDTQWRKQQVYSHGCGAV